MKTQIRQLNAESDFSDEQTDLGLCCLLIAPDTFSVHCSYRNNPKYWDRQV